MAYSALDGVLDSEIIPWFTLRHDFMNPGYMEMFEESYRALKRRKKREKSKSFGGLIQKDQDDPESSRSRGRRQRGPKVSWNYSYQAPRKDSFETSFEMSQLNRRDSRFRRGPCLKTKRLKSKTRGGAKKVIGKTRKMGKKLRFSDKSLNVKKVRFTTEYQSLSKKIEKKERKRSSSFRRIGGGDNSSHFNKDKENKTGLKESTFLAFGKKSEEPKSSTLPSQTAPEVRRGFFTKTDEVRKEKSEPRELLGNISAKHSNSLNQSLQPALFRILEESSENRISEKIPQNQKHKKVKNFEVFDKPRKQNKLVKYNLNLAKPVQSKNFIKKESGANVRFLKKRQKKTLKRVQSLQNLPRRNQVPAKPSRKRIHSAPKNLKFTYEPRRFNRKILSIWEEKAGKKWYKLTLAERVKANQEMKEIAENGSINSKFN